MIRNVGERSRRHAMWLLLGGVWVGGCAQEEVSRDVDPPLYEPFDDLATEWWFVRDGALTFEFRATPPDPRRLTLRQDVVAEETLDTPLVVSWTAEVDGVEAWSIVLSWSDEEWLLRVPAFGDAGGPWHAFDPGLVVTGDVVSEGQVLTTVTRDGVFVSEFVAYEGAWRWAFRGLEGFPLNGELLLEDGPARIKGTRGDWMRVHPVHLR